MVTNKTYSYGIRYRVIKLDEDEYILKPEALEGGLSDKIAFSSDNGIFPILRNKNSFTNKSLVSKIYFTDELEQIYDYEEDTDTLGQYFYADHENTLLYCKIDKDGNLKIYEVNLDKYKKGPRAVSYRFDEGETPIAILNEAAIDDLDEAPDLETVKRRLVKYKASLKDIENWEEQGITRVTTTYDKISAIDLRKTVEDEDDEEEVEQEKEGKKQDAVEVAKTVNAIKKVEPERTSDISYKGLYDAISKEVLGHDKQIKIIARKLYLNHIAKPGRKVKSILITGPTGVGKTQTVKAAARYLNVPYVYVNISKLVGEGIVGIKVEDKLYELFRKSGKRLPIAQRGLFFGDEFDKLNFSQLDVKMAVRPSLLSLTDGEPIDVPQIKEGPFDTSMLNRVYGGVFDRIEEKYRHMGFGATEEKLDGELTGKKIKDLIIEKGYFTREEISRVQVFLRYGNLDAATKKQILLNVDGSSLNDKILRFKEDFGVDLIISDDFVNAFMDQEVTEEEGMRDVDTSLEEVLGEAEEELCLAPKNKYKRLILTRKTVEDPTQFDLT